MVELPSSVLDQYATVSLYNSPYPAHEAGRAIDLYPGPARDATAPSPVAGGVVHAREVSAPTRSYATSRDYLLVIDTGEHLARLLHVEPAVGEGDRVEIGDSLGETVRSGYFDPWVADHLHLGFRPRDADPLRASGSLPLELGTPIEPVTWDGTGTVRERGPTYAVLDSPSHPASGEAFAGIATESGVLDGGLPHYPRGGLLDQRREDRTDSRQDSEDVALLGERIGEIDGRSVRWTDVRVLANGEEVAGVSMALWRDEIAVTLVDPEGVPFEPGEDVRVSIRT